MEDWLGVNNLPQGPKIDQLPSHKGTYLRLSDLGIVPHPEPDGDTYLFTPEAQDVDEDGEESEQPKQVETNHE